QPGTHPRAHQIGAGEDECQLLEFRGFVGHEAFTEVPGLLITGPAQQFAERGHQIRPKREYPIEELRRYACLVRGQFTVLRRDELLAEQVGGLAFVVGELRRGHRIRPFVSIRFLLPQSASAAWVAAGFTPPLVTQVLESNTNRLSISWVRP